MKYLKDITALNNHKHADFITRHLIWDTPIRFINKDMIALLYIDAKNSLGEEVADEIIALIMGAMVMAKFLGLIPYSQIDNVHKKGEYKHL